MNVGLITYDFNHLKTEYVVKKLSEDKRLLDTNTCYALQEEAKKKNSI